MAGPLAPKSQSDHKPNPNDPVSRYNRSMPSKPPSGSYFADAVSQIMRASEEIIRIKKNERNPSQQNRQPTRPMTQQAKTPVTSIQRG